VMLGQKVHSFRHFSRLPLIARTRMKLALNIGDKDEADRRALVAGGWHVVDASRVAASPDAYQRFIQQSSAEIGIAKHGYVVARAGWFSDRSAAYLASGRPVVAQDTGMGDRLPTGRGLLTFTESSEAVEQIDRLRRDYVHHAEAAKRIARESLSPSSTLAHLLSDLGIAG
jgi:hypothetical protein